MGFKMKGSAFKLGGVQGTSGHASALKQHASALKHAEDQRHWHGPYYIPEKYGGRNVREEFNQWKKDNPNTPVGEWINNWKEEVNDPTMPSQKQAAELVLPKWAQEKYNLKEGAVLGDSWNALIPSSGGSHHSRIVSMNSGLSAAVPHEKHDNFEDNRTDEEKKRDEMNYKQIVAEAGGEDSEDYLEWKKGQDEIELQKKQEIEAKEKEVAEAKRLEEEAAEAKRLEEEETARIAQLDKQLKNATSELDYGIANYTMLAKSSDVKPEAREFYENAIAEMKSEREGIVNKFEKMKSGEENSNVTTTKTETKNPNEPVKFGYHTEEGEVK